MPNLQCSFEESCFWKMLPTSNGTWTVGEAKDNTEGPHYDHTQQNENGHYAFLTEPKLFNYLGLLHYENNKKIYLLFTHIKPKSGLANKF